MDNRCPNCGTYYLSESLDRGQLGIYVIVFSLLGVFITLGSSDLHGGRLSFDSLYPLIIVGVVFGIILFISEIIIPTRVKTKNCSNCNYSSNK